MKLKSISAFLVSILVCAQAARPQSKDEVATIHVDTTPGHELNTFDPDVAIGSSIDALSHSSIDKVYTPHIIQESLGAGWGPISYRNNTELRMAAWHWTENGTWSDAEGKRGYFTGSTELKEPIRYILPYALPHRGFSTSGDRPIIGPNLTYWKSNPYLTSKFTGESDALHPQWVVIDLKSQKAVNAIRIAWAAPFATTYRVEYWVGKNPLEFDKGPDGEWKTFDLGAQKNATGGTETLKLASVPATAQYFRIWMTESSNTCDEHGSGDIRNCVGYAIKEIELGTVDANNEFKAAAQDADEQQKFTYCSSSIDPWHSADDVNSTGPAQHTGFDLFYTSGITNGLPARIPVTMLYGTPDDAAAQIAYIEKRGYPISGIELGEEPDGKHALPEDYGALYIQWAKAIHKVDPTLKLGGPIFEGVNEDITVWPDDQGRKSWMGRFVAYLKSHGRLRDLAFVSFEHYPYEPCTITWKSLYEEPQLTKHILQVWRDDGVPKDVPLMITEDHLAAALTGPMSTIFSGLWLADNVGSFFEGGGAVFYHSPIQPEALHNTCLGWATWSNFIADANYYNIFGYTALYYSARVINLEWVQHHSGTHKLFPTTSKIEDSDGNQLVTSYAVHRPDGQWALLLVNRDENTPHTVRIAFDDKQHKKSETFIGPVSFTTFGSEQYVWKNDGENSHADPDGPPFATIVPDSHERTFMLPKASVTVLRGNTAASAR